MIRNPLKHPYLKAQGLHLKSKIAQPFNNPQLFSMALWCTAIAFCAYSGLSFGLDASDQVKELAGLTAETSKIVKNGCYIAGSASALVGAIWAVASQSLKVAASSAAITIVSLKAATFFTGTLLI